MVRFMITLNLIAFCIYDYEIRVLAKWPQINRISLGLEFLCQIFLAYKLMAIITLSIQNTRQQNLPARI